MADYGESSMRVQHQDTESNLTATNSLVSPGPVEVICNMQVAGIWPVRYPVKRHISKKELFPASCL